jgi:hypothetical protein
MLNIVKLNNSAGQKAEPVDWYCPIPGTGVKLTTDADVVTNKTATVVAGKRYMLVNSGVGNMFFGIADATVDANKLWNIPKLGRLGIQIPIGYTTLHFIGDANSCIAYMVEVDSDGGT